MSQILTTHCCNSNNLDYTVTYKKQLEEVTRNICNACWNRPYPIKADDITTKNIKIFQTEVSKIICNKCNENVTETMGCETCHPKENS